MISKAMQLRWVLGVLTCLAFGSLNAEHPGWVAYQKVCIVCHGPDGKGVAGGIFPPIKDSEWLKGDPERSIHVVVFGLEGALEVKGKSYNALMPPQGAMLDNQTIADILNYVRATWNGEKEVATVAMVQKVRDARKSEAPWQADELLKVYPMSDPNFFPLENTMVSYYEGDWNKLPDFSQLKPKQVQEWKKPLSIDKVTKSKEHFGLVYEADFIAQKEGFYNFDMASDDGGRLSINGKVVVEHDGIHPLVNHTGKLKLDRGVHKFRLEYFQKGGGQGLVLSVKTPLDKKSLYLTDNRLKVQEPVPVIEIKPEEKAIVMRQFVENGDARAIAVGHPEKLHFTFDPQRMQPAIMWSGNFLDAGKPWTGRGTGWNPVFSEKPGLLKFRQYPFATLTDRNQAWPSVDEGMKASLGLQSTARDFDYRFKGYELDSKTGRPTFFYNYKDFEISETYTPDAEKHQMIRKLSIKRPVSNEQTLMFQVIQGLEVSLKDHRVQDGCWQLQIQAAEVFMTSDHCVRCPIDFKQDQAEIVLTYQWEE